MDIRKFFETRVGFPRRTARQPVRAAGAPHKRSVTLPMVPKHKLGLSAMIVDNDSSNNALPCVSTFITNSSSDQTQANGSVSNLSFEQLYTRQLMWIKHGTIYGYKLLGQLLLQRGMERYLIEILYNIHGPLFEYNQYNSNTNLTMSGCKGNVEYVDSLKNESNKNRLNCKHKGIYYWDIEWMCQWLGTLSFLTESSGLNSRKHQSEIDTLNHNERNSKQASYEEMDDLTLLQNLFRIHCIDGPCFMEMSASDWKEHIMWSNKTNIGIGIRLDASMGVHYEARMCRCFYLLSVIRDGWMCKYGVPLAVNDEKNQTEIVSAKEQIYSVCGISFLETCISDPGSAASYSNEKDQVECVYGQFVVLGHKESRFNSVRYRTNNPNPNPVEGLTRSDRHIANAISNNNPNLLHIGMCNDIFILKQRPVGNSSRVNGTNANIRVSSSSNSNSNNSTGKTKSTIALPEPEPVPELFNSDPHSNSISNVDLDINHISHYVTDTQSNYVVRELANRNNRFQTNIAEVAATTTSPNHDSFQIGRLSHVYGNDIVIKGKLHESVYVPDTLSGPVSRYACRIECERTPPYRCFIYAGGYDRNSNGEDLSTNVKLGPNAPTWYCNTSIPQSALIFKNAHTTTGKCATNRSGTTNRKMNPPNSICRIKDGFTTYGVRLYHPISKRWFEISKLGLCYNDRGKDQLTILTPKELDLFSPELLNPHMYSNELIDGCLIDIGGVTMIFQSPNTMRHNNQARLHMHPESILNSLNMKNPHCPVLFSQLKFVYISQYKRALRNKRFNHSGNGSVDWRIENELQPNNHGNHSDISNNSNNSNNSNSNNNESGNGNHFISTTSTSYSPDGKHYNMHSFYVPHVDNYCLSDTTQRAYVFPACGHVYGYHESLDNKPCPLCRKKGPFVPIAFEYDEKYGKPYSKYCGTVGTIGAVVYMQSASNITSTKNPTYVFNPCGHVTDKETCQKYASIRQRIMNNMGIRKQRAPQVQEREIYRAKCPFCATVLASSGLEGGPYNKLNYQCEDAHPDQEHPTSTSTLMKHTSESPDDVFDFHHTHATASDNVMDIPDILIDSNTSNISNDNTLSPDSDSPMINYNRPFYLGS